MARFHFCELLNWGPWLLVIWESPTWPLALSKPARERESIKSVSKTEITNSCNLILTETPHNLCHVLWFRSKLQIVRPTHNPGEKITKRYYYQNMGIIEGPTYSLPSVPTLQLKSVAWGIPGKISKEIAQTTHKIVSEKKKKIAVLSH